MKNDPLAQKWLKGFCYYHSRRWMFVDVNGEEHPSGCSKDTVDRGGVEGVAGWIDGFVDDGYFTGTPFDPLSASPQTPPPDDPPPGGGITTCEAEAWNVVAQIADGIPSTLNQVSGLAASPNLPGFWCVRDDTAESIFYMIQTTPGTFTATEVALTGTNVGNGDWEDVAVNTEDGVTYVYIHSNRGNSSNDPSGCTAWPSPPPPVRPAATL